LAKAPRWSPRAVVHGGISIDFIITFIIVVVAVTIFVLVVHRFGILIADPLGAPKRMKLVLFSRLIIVFIKRNVAVITGSPRQRKGPGEKAQSSRG
jgi:hypothetical protein